MFKIDEQIDEEGYRVYQIADMESKARLTVNAERGGIITGLCLDGRELLYLNREIYRDRNRYIRGGIPILFPTIGKLTEDHYQLDGADYQIPIHGFARNLPWRLEEKDEERGSLTFALHSTEETKKSYPFDFALLFTYKLGEKCVRIEQEVYNKSNQKMPFSLGLHPYFKREAGAALKTDAEHYQDLAKEETFALEESAELGKETSWLLLDAKKPELAVDLGTYRIVLNYSTDYRYQLIWSIQEEGFVCLEPWTAKADAMNSGKDLIILMPGEKKTFWVEISLEDGQRS